MAHKKPVYRLSQSIYIYEQNSTLGHTKPATGFSPSDPQ